MFRQKLKKLNLRLHKQKEEEGKYVSRKIMEEIAQNLTGLGYEVADMEKLIDEEDLNTLRPILDSRLREMKRTLISLIATCRDISTTIRPAVLDDFGFTTTLMWYAREIEENYNIICDIKGVRAEMDLDPATGETLFHVCREVFENIIAHSGAQKVAIRLTEEKKSLTLIITDNGIGITSQDKSSSESIGLLRIRELVRSIGGKTVIRGRKGRGTSIIVTVPLNQ